MKIKLNNLILVATLCAALTQINSAQAKAGATDVIPGTSKSGVATGGTAKGGGSRSTTPTTPTTPTVPVAPAPIVTATLAFTSSGAAAGNCNGSYRIDPYYPTLSLLTVTVSVDSMNVSDNSALSVNVVTAGGTAYPFTSNAINVVAGAGTVSYSIYVTPGTSVAGVVVKDAFGVIDFAGN
ncbi:MAG: hypothetical protein RLZZ350_211 [Verrucomicrobiota bacterium]|jgi:hypothetical protein